MKQIISLILVLVLISFVLALPDIYTGVKIVEIPDSASSGSGTIDNYVDGDSMSSAGYLNDVLISYTTPPNTVSAIFYYRINFKGESPTEYQADVDSSCLLDSVQIKQVQAESGSGTQQILTTSCYDGASWIEIDSVTKAKPDGTYVFIDWYHSEMGFSISEKVTPALQKNITAGEVIEQDLGIIEEETSSDYGAIISQTQNSLTEYLEFMGIRIWENEILDSIIDYEVLAMSVDNPDFIQINRGSLFLESEPDITIKGSTGTFQTYLASDGVNDGYISDSIDGTSLLFVSASAVPTDYYIFSIYDSAL